jgi:hypothetical protein
MKFIRKIAFNLQSDYVAVAMILKKLQKILKKQQSTLMRVCSRDQDQQK